MQTRTLEADNPGRQGMEKTPLILSRVKKYVNQICHYENTPIQKFHLQKLKIYK